MRIESSSNSSARSTTAAFACRRWGALLLIVCVGCGRGGIPVDGTVLVAGKPVTEGTIAFEPADGAGLTVGAAIHDGNYHVGPEAGMQPGKKLARITAVYKTGRQVAAGTPAPPGTMSDEVKTISPPPEPCEVVAGAAKRLDFDLAQ